MVGNKRNVYQCQTNREAKYVMKLAENIASEQS